MSDYINGSDLLLSIGGGAVGHCTSHTITFNSETKERAVKPLASLPVSSGLWKGKGVTGLSISISADGLRFYTETENGFSQIVPSWGAGTVVEVQAFERGSEAPYLKGNFVIASIEETSPAQDDATYKISLENDGEPIIYPGKTTPTITLNKSAAVITAGEDIQLVASVVPLGSIVTWTSSATAKATVNNGLVHGAAAGSSTITAKITVDGTDYTATCAVTVNAVAN